jgi:hypothetical protein
VPSRQPLDQQREGRFVVNAVGDREDRLLGRRDVLRVAPGADERDDALAAVLAHARDLATGDQRQVELGEV